MTNTVKASLVCCLMLFGAPAFTQDKKDDVDEVARLFETYGLTKEVSSVNLRVSNSKLEFVSGGFGSSLFHADDKRANFPQWLFTNKIVKEGLTLTIYRGYLPGGLPGLRLVITDKDGKKMPLAKESIALIEKNLPRNGYVDLTRDELSFECVYGWSQKSSK